MSKTYSAGIVTAYGAAKRAGYTGTYEDFCRQQAEYAESAAAVEQAKTTAVNAAATATTKAGETTTAATAAQTAKAQTEAAASKALTDISTARSGAISAVQTEGQTQTANARAQAQAAAQSATTASTKASEASASATSAGQSATNAAASATSAAQSASNAQNVLDSIPADYSDLSANVSQLSADLVSNDVIKQRYNAVSVSPNDTINASGKVGGGTADGSAYIFNVPEGTTIDYSGGSVYGLFATLPVRNETVTVDGTRHIAASAKITMPTGANYLAIRASAEPSVLSTNETISEKFDGVTTNLDTIDTTISDLLETGIEFTENGFINAYGAFIENNNYKATDFVNCVVGGTFVPYKYRLQMFANTKIAYYNNAKELISVISPSVSQSLEYVEGVVPYVDGATYVRFCTGKKAVGYYVKYATIKNYCTVVNEESTNPCDYIGDEISVFNKILCIGDSLTSGTFNYREDGSTGHYINDTKYAYPTYLKKLTGCETTNMGNGGMSSAEWYTAHGNDDLSGYDCAIIQLGVNDCIRYTTWCETSETAFTNIINKLKTENKNIKIFIANIIPATSYSSEQYVAISSALLAWVTSTYASDENVIPLDMQQYGHTKDNPAYNCGHLSALGYRRLAQDYKGYIGWYINQNKNVFKEVQFIGTNYYYDPI